MSATYIEHVNLTVGDPGRSAGLFEALFGWKLRWKGPSLNGGVSWHVGDERTYIALYSPPVDSADSAVSHFPKGKPLNHVGIVVDDIDEIERRVRAAGLAPTEREVYDPGQRFYFFDPDGIEFEIVSYG